MNDNRRRCGYERPSRCWSFMNQAQETISHVLIRSHIANRTWSYFYSFMGKIIKGLSLRETIGIQMSGKGKNLIFKLLSQL